MTELANKTEPTTTKLRDIKTRLGRKEAALRECMYSTLLEAIQRCPSDGDRPLRVLDVGAGRGEIMRMLRENGCEPTGVDVEAECVSLCQEFGPAHQGGFADLASLFSPGDFDVVICSHVIEHVDSPLDCLRQAHVLQAKHYVYAVPNVLRSIRLVRALLGNGAYDHPTHVFGWGKPEFKALLERAGYEVKRWDIDRVTLNPLKGRLGTVLTKLFSPLETKLLPWMFPLLSSSLIAECGIRPGSENQ